MPKSMSLICLPLQQPVEQPACQLLHDLDVHAALMLDV